jgi:YfiH family protein
MNDDNSLFDYFLTPDWPAPEHVVAVSSCRQSGVRGTRFLSPYDSFNVAAHVDDDEQNVAVNRQQLLQACQGLQRIDWLNQVHSDRCAEAGAQPLDNADASFTAEHGLGCAVMTADCLPLLLCDKKGQRVAAAHAGWRGLAAGIIENTVAKFSCPQELMVWLGPAISQAHFEVGATVREHFLAAAKVEDQPATDSAFEPNLQCPHHYFADLYQLARIRLLALGVEQIYGGNYCTFAQQEHFFSYRRDGVCGRMVSLIYIKDEI